MKKNIRDQDRRRSRNAYHEARRAANDRKQEAQYRDGFGKYRAVDIHIVPLTDEVTAAMEAGGLTLDEWDAAIDKVDAPTPITMVDIQKTIAMMPEMGKN